MTNLIKILLSRSKTFFIPIAAGIMLGIIFVLPQLKIFILLSPFLLLTFLKKVARTPYEAACGGLISIFILALAVFWNLKPNAESWHYIAAGINPPTLYLTYLIYFLLWIAISLWVALPYGLFGYIYWKYKQNNFFNLILAPSLWVLAEFIRIKLFFGINYVNVGYWLFALFPFLGIIGRYTGILGLSFVTIFIAEFFTILFFDGLSLWNKNKFVFLSGCTLVIAGLSILYFWTQNIYLSESQRWQGAPIEAYAIQGYIPWGNSDSETNENSHDLSLPNNYYSLLQATSFKKNSIIVFPEEVLPTIDLQAQSRQWTDEVRALQKLRSQLDANLLAIGQNFRINGKLFNGTVVIDNKNQITIAFKNGLLPFAEYVPFLPQDVNEQYFFAKGNGIKTIHTDLGVVGTLSCIELLMPRLVRQEINGGAEILLSGGSEIAWNRIIWKQNLLENRFEAVAQKRFIVRAVKRGYSAIINPLGEVLVQSNGIHDSVINAEVDMIDEKKQNDKLTSWQ